ncbi:MAG: nucleotidyl transferase AbiEii/AbiGii toxin family protein [Deltaproteobacteria bacterium]|nr:nucleotidyl transferase AbiEii/AbiGii toxin family protein [Deltaproteobacteria bacterium]
MFPSLLSPLQRRLLASVAEHLRGVFLTGGCALGAVYLGHRRSADLDLFTREASSFDALVKQFLLLVQVSGLSASPGAAGPGFRRFVVSDGAEDVPVDLAIDSAPGIAPVLVLPDGLAVDSIEDIAANKLCAILGRAEVRDYVDLYFLAHAGRDPLAMLDAARRKDGALDAATLAFVLSEVRVRRAPEGIEKPLPAEDLQAFIDDLRRRLARAAFPQTP